MLYIIKIYNCKTCSFASVDSRGENYLKNIFQEIAGAMGCDNCEKAVQKLQDVFDGLELMIPKASPEDYAILNNSVNSVRLKNHPIEITSETIFCI